MGKLLDNLDFDEWLIYAFDHPVTQPQWHFDIDVDFWDELKNPSLTVDYMTRLFTHASTLLAPYSDEQVKQGLNYIINGSLSNYIVVLKEFKKDIQRKFWESVYQLYAKVFAVRCTPHLCYINEKGESPINHVCYMWWDVMPIVILTPDKKRTSLGWDSLAIMKRILTISHDACRESALHGLGHWHYAFPDEVPQIIDAFLKANPDLRPELRQYAQYAWRGGVQ